MGLPEVIFDPGSITPEEHLREVNRVFEWPIPPDGIRVGGEADSRRVVISHRHLGAAVLLCAGAALLAASAISAFMSREPKAIAGMICGLAMTWAMILRYFGTVWISDVDGLITISEGVGALRAEWQFNVKRLRVILSSSERWATGAKDKLAASSDGPAD